MARRSRKNKKTVMGRLLAILKWLMILAILAAVTGIAGIAGIFYYYGRELPEILDRDDYDPPQVSQILTDDGEILAEFHVPGERRTLIPLDEIPDTVQFAFMAAEDSEFMTHAGIDYLGMLRAVYYAVRYDQGMRATSTITMQLVKNLILTPERSVRRKIQEIILTRELEQNLSKEDILYMYLNTIYLGHGTHGVEEASRFYFGKSVRDISIAEAALLAGLTAGPEAHTPLRHPERAERRRTYVLRQMWEKGFINEGSYREAMDTPIETVPVTDSYPYRGFAPYFTENVRRAIVDEYGRDLLMTGGMRVHTTLNIEMQRAAESAARKGLRAYDERQGFYRPQRRLEEDAIEPFLATGGEEAGEVLTPGTVYEVVVTSVDPETDQVIVGIGDIRARLLLEPRSRIVGEGSDKKPLEEVLARGDVLRVLPTTHIQATTEDPTVRFETGAEVAVIVMDPHTREVRALVGGYDFGTNEFDSATQARRQTGSSFKTLVYAAALDAQAITPASVYLDSPTVFQLPNDQSWSPRNADGQWRGPIRVREALAASRNVVAVRVLDEIGIEDAIAFARRLGITSPLAQNYTMVMGSSEMPPLEITNAYATFAAGGEFARPRFLNRVESYHGDRTLYHTHTEPVLAPEVAYLTTSLLLSAVDTYRDSTGRNRFGTGHVIRALGHPVAGKTGTTNDSRDAWFIGYTPDLVIGVWVGFGDNRSLGRGQYGGNVAAPIFRDTLEKIVGDREPLHFEEPAAGITEATIDHVTGKLARTGGIEEIFLVGTAPTQYAPEEEEDSGEDFFLRQFQ